MLKLCVRNAVFATESCSAHNLPVYMRFIRILNKSKCEFNIKIYRRAIEAKRDRILNNSNKWIECVLWEIFRHRLWVTYLCYKTSDISEIKLHNLSFIMTSSDVVFHDGSNRLHFVGAPSVNFISHSLAHKSTHPTVKMPWIFRNLNTANWRWF